jgi:hypothetical protein
MMRPSNTRFRSITSCYRGRRRKAVCIYLMRNLPMQDERPRALAATLAPPLHPRRCPQAGLDTVQSNPRWAVPSASRRIELASLAMRISTRRSAEVWPRPTTGGVTSVQLPLAAERRARQLAAMTG